MSYINVAFGFYVANGTSNPNLSNQSLVSGYKNSDGIYGSVGFTGTDHGILDSSKPVWGGSSSVNGYTGKFTSGNTSGQGGATVLLGLGATNNVSATFIFLGSGNVSPQALEMTGWTYTPVLGGFTLAYSGAALTYVPYLTITMNGSNSLSMEITSSTHMYVQNFSCTENYYPLPPYKFELVATYKSPGFLVDISALGNSGYYTESSSANISLTNSTTPIPISSGQGFGSNLAQSITPKGTFTTLTFAPGGLLLFIGKGTLTDDEINSVNGTYISFSVNGFRVNFPIIITGQISPSWVVGNYGSYIGLYDLLNITYNTPTLDFLAIQVNFDNVNYVSFDVNLATGSPATPNIGLQGMQFSTTSPIPVCLVNDCMVWTSQGLEKIQDLKSGCQLVAVDIEGNEFLAKFDVFEQTPRDGEISICRHEEDVIVSDHHTILYTNEEVQRNNFKCFYCEDNKPYKNELNKESCHHCHIFSIKDYTPVLSKDSWLPLEKIRGTLYHVIPEDLVNVKGFKVGKRRVLISEITSSDIQLLMSGFVKV